MVQLTGVTLGMMKTFGRLSKWKAYNHRKPVKYQRFQANIDPEKIVEHYSRDDIETINPRAGIRTFGDAVRDMGRTNLPLPSLNAQDLELNDIFQKELDRQRAIVARINKIRVVVDSVPGKGTELLMNKDISTPFNCASHIHDLLTSRSVVAEILPIESSSQSSDNLTTTNTTNFPESVTSNTDASNQTVSKDQSTPRPILWDMHRPLQESCRLKFRHFAENNVAEINKIYWRSCSFVLGMAVRLAFKDNIKVLPHSWPKPNIKSGSFVYDVAMNLSNTWQPNEQELRAFTKIMWEIKGAALPFERLQVDGETAMKLFATNPLKQSQIESILENETSKGKVTVYRCGGLLDMSVGPMIANTSQIGRITLAAVHPFESESNDFKGVFYRFQGVSLPQQLPMSSYLYQNVIINNAKKLNKASL